jgi:hypothetical protein
MALIEEALYSLLANTPSIVALVDDRIYPNGGAEDDRYPLVTYEKIRGASEQSHDGISGLAHPIFQINCFASKYSDTITLAEAIRLLLQGYRGTVAGVEIQSSRFLGDQDVGRDPETKAYARVLDFEIYHSEAQS